MKKSEVKENNRKILKSHQDTYKEMGKLHFACLCAGLRRRNAGLCLKCEVKRMHDTFPNLELDAYDDGYKHAKQDFLRLLEQ